VLAVNAQVGLRCSGGTGHLVAQYTYDGQGALVKRTMAEEGTWTVYIGGIYEESSDGQEVTYVKYYSAFGRRIAMRSGSEGSAGVVNYILSDHLGSSTVVTDSAGGDVRAMKYYPYGAERPATGTMTEPPITDKLFTGQQREEPETISALGLYDYGARFYSTLMGRFLSPDPLIAAPGDPQALNRYSYVRNNPLIFVDPTGLQMAIICGWGQNCEGTGDDPMEIGGYREWAIWYWHYYEHLSTRQATDRWDRLVHDAKNGMSQDEIFKEYDILFINTEISGPPSGASAPFEIEKAIEGLRKDMDLYVAHAGVMLDKATNWDVVMGFSLGGAVLSHVMARWGYLPANAAIFVEAALDELGAPINAYDFPTSRILVVHETGKVAHVFDIAHGDVPGALRINSGECGGTYQHCTMEGSARLAMALAYVLPPGANPAYDRDVVRYMRALGANMCIADFPISDVEC
jgi:RHS repeat-associated protein